MVTVTDSEVRMIRIDELVESPLNPRQQYPQAAMDELVQSMKTSGFRTWLPLLVRPAPDDVWRMPALEQAFEIGAGHRRSRAARLAGLEMVPCIVRPMSDEEFLDVLNFDNSGREDVHPLDEASGWRQWMEKTGKSVLDIAARIGQSKEYVYQRLKYADLIPEAKQSFLDGGITARHAVQIARRSPEGQVEALEFCRPGLYGQASARQLQDWIQGKFFIVLGGSPFDVDDAALFPEAGSCWQCPKRVGNAPEEFPEISNPDTCSEKRCWIEKSKRAAVVREKAAADAAAEQRNKQQIDFKETRRASAKERDQQKESERQAQIERRKEVESAAKLNEKFRLEQQAAREKDEAEERGRQALLESTLERVKWPPQREDLVPLLFDRPDVLEEFFPDLPLREWTSFEKLVSRMSDTEFARLVVRAAHWPGVDRHAGWERVELVQAAKRYGVGLKPPAAKKVPKPKLATPKLPKRTLSGAARKRIAAAQKQRWAAHKKQQAGK